MSKWQPAMEEKNATRERKVGILPFKVTRPRAGSDWAAWSKLENINATYKTNSDTSFENVIAGWLPL